jgi:hypothetical protein
MDELRKKLGKDVRQFNVVTRRTFESTHGSFCEINSKRAFFRLPNSANLKKDVEMLKRSPALSSTAEAATDLFSRLNTLWEFSRRGHFHSENRDIEEMSTNIGSHGQELVVFNRSIRMAVLNDRGIGTRHGNADP